MARARRGWPDSLRGPMAGRPECIEFVLFKRRAKERLAGSTALGPHLSFGQALIGSAKARCCGAARPLRQLRRPLGENLSRHLSKDLRKGRQAAGSLLNPAVTEAGLPIRAHAVTLCALSVEGLALIHQGGMVSELFALAVAVAACAVLTALLIRLAPRWGLVDHPQGRKDHAQPTPVVGGIAIFVALALAASVWPQLDSTPWFLLLAAALLVSMGVIDDLVDLNWKPRIGAQALAAGLIALGGGAVLVRLGDSPSMPLSLGLLALPVTVFAVVGIINAINMADGADGVAGVLVLASLAMIAALAVGVAPEVHEVSLLAAGALVGFLWFNLRRPGQSRARTFMGNSGSALLGLIVAWAAIRLTHAPGSPVTPALAPWLVAVPIADCITLIVRRVVRGRSPFKADRDHLHHLLLDRGWSVSGLVIFALVYHLLAAAMGYLLWRSGVSDPGLIGGFLLLIALHYAGTGWLGRVRLQAEQQRATEFDSVELIAPVAIVGKLPARAVDWGDGPKA